LKVQQLSDGDAVTGSSGHSHEIENLESLTSYTSSSSSSYFFLPSPSQAIMSDAKTQIESLRKWVVEHKSNP